MRPQTILGWQPFFPFLGNDFFSIVQYNRILFPEQENLYSDMLQHFLLIGFCARARECFKPAGASGIQPWRRQQSFHNLVHRTNPYEVFPMVQIFPITRGIFQSCSVFAINGAVVEELFDIIIYHRPPSHINTYTLQCVNDLENISEFFKNLLLEPLQSQAFCVVKAFAFFTNSFSF